MGNFDRKNICVEVKTRENFTDPRITEFIKNWDFAYQEYRTFMDSVRATRTNEYSKRIVEFFVNYKDGVLLPDKCDAYEPIKEDFNKDNISAPVSWLSHSAGSLMLKKKYKYTAEIKNNTFAVFFSDGELSPPTVALPEYLGRITFWFSKQRKIDMVFLEQLLRDLVSYLDADNGTIFDQETKDVLLGLGVDKDKKKELYW